MMTRRGLKIGQKVEISLTDSQFGFYKRNKRENKFINRLIIIAKVCISKSKYGKHFNLTFLFKNELNSLELEYTTINLQNVT